jgi:hypothetical protein
MPPASTSSAAMVDLPEGEGADWHAVRAFALGGVLEPHRRQACDISRDVDVAALACLSARHRST